MDNMASTGDNGFGSSFEQIVLPHAAPVEETEKTPFVEDSHVKECNQGTTDPDETPITPGGVDHEKDDDASYLSRVVDYSSSWVENPLVRFVLHWQDSHYNLKKTTHSLLPFKYPTGRGSLPTLRYYENDIYSIFSADDQFADAGEPGDPTTEHPEEPARDDEPKPVIEIITRALTRQDGNPSLRRVDPRFEPSPPHLHRGDRGKYSPYDLETAAFGGETIMIHSSQLTNAIRAVTHYHPNVVLERLRGTDINCLSLPGNTDTYHYLYHISEDLRAYRDNQPELHDEKYAQETAEQVDLLLSYIQYRFEGQNLVTEDLRGSDMVDSVSLWKLYRPGTMAYYRENENSPQKPCVIHKLFATNRGPEMPFTPDSSLPSRANLNFWTVSWKNGCFERIDMSVKLDMFTPQRIDSLPVVPAQFIDTGSGLEEHELGAFCWKLTHKPAYLELSPDYKLKHTTRAQRTGLPMGRVIVDFDEAPADIGDDDVDLYSSPSRGFRRTRAGQTTPIVIPSVMDMPKREGRCECTRCLIVLGPRRGSVFWNLNWLDPDVDEMPKCKEYFHAMDKNVPAWILSTSCWEQVPARHLHRINFSRDMNQDFVQSQEVTEAMKLYSKMLASVSTWNNPGDSLPPLSLSPLTNYNGHVVLLHGPPGTGKSSSIIQLAEATSCPIVLISSTLLGSPYYPVLSELLAMSERYGCILLIENAEAILGHRTKRVNLENKVFALFIQALETFNGLLFLTTNRLTDLDPAVISHINTSIYFPPLTTPLRATLWRSRFAAIEARNREIREAHRHTTTTSTTTAAAASSSHTTTRVSVESSSEPRNTKREGGQREKEIYISPQTQAFLLENKDIAAMAWNGREVVKALESAVMMARAEDQEVGFGAEREGGTGRGSASATVVVEEHFRRVIRNSGVLRDYVRGGDDAE